VYKGDKQEDTTDVPLEDGTLSMPVMTCFALGDAKTSPETLAESIPLPTYEAWAGSCPEPPPERTATLLESWVESNTTLSDSIKERPGLAAIVPRRDLMTRPSGFVKKCLDDMAVSRVRTKT
jgi:hypothetical protein